jgi:hypothetical protein
VFTDDAILMLAPASSGKQDGWLWLADESFYWKAEFFADRGSMLGWLLESGLAVKTIRENWQAMLFQR